MASSMTSRCNRAVRAAAVAIVSTSLALSAAAETVLITRSGAWQAFGGTTTSGRPVCGVSQSDEGRYFGLKFYAGDSTFTVQIGGKGWQLENGARQKLQMALDGNPPWTATGTAMHFNDGDAGLEFTINRSEIDKFAAEFRTSSSLGVRFTDWNQAGWSLSLAGSNAVTDAFLGCIVGLK
jgi:hypothetical protein